MNIATDNAATDWAAHLLREGWCIIPDALPAETIAALDADLASTFARTPFCEGGFYGATTKRFGRLLARSERAAALVQQDRKSVVSGKSGFERVDLSGSRNHK